MNTAATQPAAESTASFGFGAGALVRSSAIFQLRALAFRLGIHFEYIEDRGWLESAYHCRTRGNANDCVYFMRVYAEMARQWS